MKYKIKCLIIFWACCNSLLSTEIFIEDKVIKDATYGLHNKITDEVLAKNLKIIEISGIRAFPFLLDQLNNEAIGSDRLQRPKVKRDPNTGERLEGLAPFLVKDIVFWILRETLEGFRPGQYTGYYVINRLDIRKWLEERPNKSLKELRIEMSKLALKQVAMQYAEDLSDKTFDDLILFKERVTKIENGESPDMGGAFFGKSE